MDPKLVPDDTMFRDPAPGAIVAGRYRIEERIAVGGMATILRAKHLGLGERVALKILLPRYRKSAEFVGRFQREARTAAQLRSEHAARVLDFGTLADGAPYLAMELLEGQDLEARLLERGPMSVGEAADVVLQACEALAEAHALGIVHRDLKPQNLFLTRAPDGGRVLKVIDFGIAKTIGGRAGLTAKHSSMGTPHYMSPEQLRATDGVDARADVWALGVILHELVTGRSVYSACTIDELLVRVATSDPTLSLEPRHAALEPVIRGCLVRDREARIASVRELAEALLPLGDVSAIDRVARLRRVEEAARARAHLRDDEDAWPLAYAARATQASVPTMAATQPASLPAGRGSRFWLSAAGAVAAAIVALVPALRAPDVATRPVAASDTMGAVRAPLRQPPHREAHLDIPAPVASATSAPHVPTVASSSSAVAAPPPKSPPPRRARSPHERDRHFTTRK